ncbi:hypothetical protein Tco_1317182 [Tanacetum coccineum]
MATPVISISSDVSVESMGSSFPRVILIGSISIEVPVAPEVGAATVAAPARVLKLDTYSSSEVDPSESSPLPIYVAPMVSPFLCLDDSESDIEMPERHVSPTPHDAMLTKWRSKVASRSSSPTTSTPEIPTAPILPTPSSIVTPLSEALTARKSVRPIPSHRLALRYTSHHLDRFTSGSSLSHSSSDHSSSGYSILGHPLSGHASPNTTIADSSTPPRFATRALVPSRVDLLLPRKIEANVMAVKVAVDRDVMTGIDVGIGIEVDVGVDVEDEVEGEVESSDRGTIEVGVDVVVKINIPNGMRMPDVVERLEQVEEGLQNIYEHNMTITHSSMTPEAIEELVNRRVEEALATYEATHATNAIEAKSQSQNGSDGDNGNGVNGNGRDGNGKDGNGGNGNPNENNRGARPIARECTY